jgi:hypothetical protein
MWNRFLFILAKCIASGISSSAIKIELSKWIEDSLPPEETVIKKIDEKLSRQNLGTRGILRVRRIQALRHPDIASILIRAGKVPPESVVSDSQGNLNASLTLPFALGWIDEHYS